MTARQPSTLSNFDDLRRITAGKVADTPYLDQLLLGPFTCTAAESIRPIYTSIYFRPGRQEVLYICLGHSRELPTPKSMGANIQFNEIVRSHDKTPEATTVLVATRIQSRSSGLS